MPTFCLVLIIIAAALLALLILYSLAANLLIRRSIHRHRRKRGLKDASDAFKKAIAALETGYLEETDSAKSWFDEQTIKVAEIVSPDGILLKSAVVLNENKTNKWALICHGYTSNHRDMLTVAKRFYGYGCNIILPDLRAHGKSGGKYIGMGWLDKNDVLQWLDYIKENYPDACVVLYGISMGGATVMMTAGENHPSVAAVVEDCGYTSVYDIMKYQLKMQFKLPEMPLMHTASVISKKLAGYDWRTCSAVEQVKKCKVPMLFIHGDKDTFVPYEMLMPLYNAASCEKEMLSVPNATHGLAAATNPTLYWDTVSAFLSKFFL